MENLNKKPVKGILKSSSSFEQAEAQRAREAEKDIKWDEMNILQTLHPPDKDYGHMKVDEPKTPFNFLVDGDVVADPFDPDVLASKIQDSDLPKILSQTNEQEEIEEEEEEQEEEEELTEEERQKRKEFEIKRKMHYNEFQVVKLARKLLEEEEEDDEDENKNDNEIETDKSNQINDDNNKSENTNENTNENELVESTIDSHEIDDQNR